MREVGPASVLMRQLELLSNEEADPCTSTPSHTHKATKPGHGAARSTESSHKGRCAREAPAWGLQLRRRQSEVLGVQAANGVEEPGTCSHCDTLGTTFAKPFNSTARESGQQEALLSQGELSQLWVCALAPLCCSRPEYSSSPSCPGMG